ncbi:type IV pilus modification PilV family protein [Rummeliibacillus sp. BSL5]
MVSQLKKIIQNEKGLTLVEVIASFVLLIIILFSFFTLFVQGSKTTKSSKSIVDATYIAQTEMENAYETITNSDSLATAEKTWITNNSEMGYSEECSGIVPSTSLKYSIYKKEKKPNPNTTITTVMRITQNQDFPTNLSNVIINVYETEGNHKILNVCINEDLIKKAKKAQMENVVEWGVSK